MARQIFRVDAWIIDSNGTYHQYEGCPTNYDSNSYSGDIDKTKTRAEGFFSEIWSAMCKVDNRQVQTVTLCTADGFQLAFKSRGSFPVDPEPNQA